MEIMVNNGGYVIILFVLWVSRQPCNSDFLIQPGNFAQNSK